MSATHHIRWCYYPRLHRPLKVYGVWCMTQLYKIFTSHSQSLTFIYSNFTGLTFYIVKCIIPSRKGKNTLSQVTLVINIKALRYLHPRASRSCIQTPMFNYIKVLIHVNLNMHLVSNKFILNEVWAFENLVVVQLRLNCRLNTCYCACRSPYTRWGRGEGLVNLIVDQTWVTLC